MTLPKSAFWRVEIRIHTRFTWFSKGNPAKTRVLAGFSAEIDECIAFWRVLGEGPEMVKILVQNAVRRAENLAKTCVLAR